MDALEAKFGRLKLYLQKLKLSAEFGSNRPPTPIFETSEGTFQKLLEFGT